MGVSTQSTWESKSELRARRAHIARFPKTSNSDSRWMTKLQLLWSTTALACARPVLLEMMLPGLSSPQSWAGPGIRGDGGHGTEGLLCWRRGPVQERDPHTEVPHRARHRHQLGRHGEDLAPHLLQRAPCCPRGAPSPPH